MEIVVAFVLLAVGVVVLWVRDRVEVRRQRVHAEVARARLIRESARW